jgi:hypothetical protein
VPKVFLFFRGGDDIFSYRKFESIRGSLKKFFCSFAPTELIICCARAGTRVPVIFVSLSVRCRLTITYLLLLLLHLLILLPAAAEGYIYSKAQT